MITIPLEHILFFSLALFLMGVMGLFLQSSILRIFLAVEAMLNGAAFGFIGTAVHYHQVDGHIMFMMILAAAAAEVSIGLALIFGYYQAFGSLDLSAVNTRE